MALAAGLTPAATLRGYSSANRGFEKHFGNPNSGKESSLARSATSGAPVTQSREWDRQVPSYTFVWPSMMTTPPQVNSRSTMKPTPMFEGS